MLEEILSYISSVDTEVIYLILILFAFIENVFPPSPSDVVIVVGSSLIATTELAYFPILILTSVGSALGFILMYYVGMLFGENLLRKGKIKFIHKDDIQKADRWFNKWGYKLILVNRFLPGTRSVISFFSGVHELNIFRTFIYAAISAFAWNAFIIWLGMVVGHNIKLIDYYLSTYSSVIGGLTLIIFAGILFKIFWRRKNKKRP